MQPATIRSTSRKIHVLTILFLAIARAPGFPADDNSVTQHIVDANQRLAQKDWKHAAQDFRACLEINAERADCDIGLGLSLWGLHDKAGALAAFHQATSLNPKSAKAHLDVAVAYRDLLENQRALDEIKTALRLQPDYEQAGVAFGLLLQQSGQPDRAIAQYRQVLQRHPRSADAHNWLGVAYLQKSNFAAAEIQFRAAIDINPNYARAYNNLGSTLAQAGDVAAGIEVLQKGLKLVPDDVELRLNLGLTLRSRGDAAEATHIFKSLLQEHPENANLAYQLGQSQRQDGDLPAAIQSLETALDANSEMPEAFYALASALTEEDAANRRKLPEHAKTSSPEAPPGTSAMLHGDLPAAVDAFRRTVEADKSNAKAHYDLGAALWYGGAHGEARSELEQAIKLSPAAAGIASFLGMVYREEGDLPRARRMFQHAVALNGTVPYCYFDLAVIYLKEQNLEAAIGQFESGLNLGLPEAAVPDLELAVSELRKAVAQDPADAEAQNTLGRLLGWAGVDPKEVIAAFDEAIRLRPDFPDAHNNLGLVYTQLGDDEKAAASFREAIGLRPDFAGAHQNLGTLLITSDASTAVQELQKAIALQPHMLKAQYNLALAYDANPTDGPQKEIEQLRAVLANDPKYPRAELALGKALLKTGKLDQAVSHLRSAVANDQKSGEALYQLGVALARAGRTQEGAETIARSREYTAVKEREQTAGLDLREGRAALDAGKTDEAVTRLERVVALQPDAPEAHYYLGLALNQRRETVQAAAEFRRAVELRPGYIEARRHLSLDVEPIQSAIQEGKFVEAEQLLHPYIESHPKSSWAWYALGYSFYGQRKIGDSIRSLAQSLQLDARNAEAHKVLGRDLMIVGRFDAAQTEFAQGMSCDPKSAEMPYNMGKLHSIQDTWDLARQNFERAIALDPSYMEAYDGLGLALESLGDKDGAIRNYRKAMEINEARHGRFSAPYVNMSALYIAAGDSKMALTFAERALVVNQNSDRALYQMAKAQEQQGAYELVVASLGRAIALNSRASAYFYLLATAYRHLGKAEESRTAMESFTRLNHLSDELEQKRLAWFREAG